LNSVGNSLPNLESRWYAISLRSRFEKKTHRELLGKGVESFLPLIEEVHTWTDRRKTILEPLFRGYLFVRTDLRNRLDILQAPGVVSFISDRGKPTAIPARQIEWVQKVVAHPGNFSRANYLNVGEHVRVTRGLFAGVEGIIARQKGAARVVLSLDAILQAVSIEVDDTMIERLPSGSKLVTPGRRATSSSLVE
jgi:transcription antitermination factor NusG